MKRILSVFLTVVMLFSFGTVMTYAEKSDFVRNGSFEELNADGVPTGWSRQGAEEHLSIVDKTKEGKNAVRLCSQTENITLTQNVTGLNDSTEYTLTAYTHIVSLTGSAQIKMEFYSATGSVGENKKSYTETTRGFVPQVITFTPPAGTIRMNLLIRVLGGGEVIWDNIKVMGEGEAPVSADGTTDFIRNGSFEDKNEDGSVASWSMLSGTVLGTNLEITDKAKEGNSALRMFADNGNMTITQNITGLKGGTEYVFTAFLKATKFFDSKAQVKVEFYAGDKSMTEGVKVDYADTSKDFEPKVITFTAPQGATRANILIRLLGGGDISWDKVSLIGEKDKGETVTPTPQEPVKPAPQAPSAPTEKEEEDKAPEVFLPGLPNTLNNGDFESDENSPNHGPWDWNPYKSKTWVDNTKSVYDKTFGHNSSRSVKITNSEQGDNPYTYQEADLIPGASYQLSAWIYIEEDMPGYSSIKIEFYNDKPKDDPERHYSEGRMGQVKTTGKQWIQVLHSFTAPAEATRIKVYPRCYGLGTFWVDDVMLCNTVKPSGVSVTTDEVFYYSDHTAPGVATGVLNTAVYPEIAGSSIDFRLTKDGTVIYEKLGVPTVDGKANFMYDVALLTEKKAEYKIEVSAAGHTNEWKIYKYDRPTYLGADGVYKKNGKVINPIFAYRYGTGEFESGVQNGIVVAQLGMPTDREGDELVAYLKQNLDAAHEAGAMNMVALYRNMLPAGNDKNIETTKIVVEALKDHPALFAWMVMDETFNHIPNPYEDLRKSYVTIRNIDPNHPVFVAEATDKMAEAGRYVDILCIDPYPGNHDAPETFVAQQTKKAFNAVKGRKPVYSLLQAIDWQGYWPTGDEMRNMIYQSLIAGGSSFGYYKFRDSIGTTDLDETDVWPYITSFAQNEQQDAFDAFVYDKYPIFSDVKNDDYWAVSFVKNGILHLVVLNRKNTEQTATIALTSINGTTSIGDYTAICAYGGNGETVSGNTTITVNLIPSGAAVYKITPQDASVLSSSQLTRFHDLEGYGWAYDSILSTDKAGIVNAIGAHKFAPEQKITRGDFAMFLIRTLGLNAEVSTSSFSDVFPGAHYAKEIAIGEALGILKGVGDGRYMPETEISRQDLMVICARGMRLVKDLGAGNASIFNDAASISDYATESIGAMTDVGIVKGYEDGTIRPLGNTTRAEAAVIMSRILGWR